MAKMVKNAILSIIGWDGKNAMSISQNWEEVTTISFLNPKVPLIKGPKPFLFGSELMEKIGKY